MWTTTRVDTIRARRGGGVEACMPSIWLLRHRPLIEPVGRRWKTSRPSNDSKSRFRFISIGPTNKGGMADWTRASRPAVGISSSRERRIVCNFVFTACLVEACAAPRFSLCRILYRAPLVAQVGAGRRLLPLLLLFCRGAARQFRFSSASIFKVESGDLGHGESGAHAHPFNRFDCRRTRWLTLAKTKQIFKMYHFRKVSRFRELADFPFPSDCAIDCRDAISAHAPAVAMRMVPTTACVRGVLHRLSHFRFTIACWLVE